MNKIRSMIKKDGVYPVLDAIITRFRSNIMRRVYSYPPGFLLGKDAVWLTGNAASIGYHVRIGRRCRMEVIESHNGAVFSPRLTIGDRVSMNDDIHIACAASITIGNDVLLASKIFISDHNHGSYADNHHDSPTTTPSSRVLNCAHVVIKNNVWIGEMVTVLPGVTIGEGSIIGSNSVVSKDIPDFTIAVGSPARPVKRYNFETAEWEKIIPQGEN